MLGSKNGSRKIVQESRSCNGKSAQGAPSSKGGGKRERWADAGDHVGVQVAELAHELRRSKV